MTVWSPFQVRMRREDPAKPDFHLLEELAKPPACVTAGRVSCWVYHDALGIREIVLSGHAEHATCSRATSILIETVRKLDCGVAWMLTCGAAYFRVETPSRAAQEALGAAVSGLRELAEHTGLVTVVDCDWQSLAAFRREVASRTGSTPPLVVLPGWPGDGPAVDYVPLVPGTDPAGEPLEFHLEGWDYDCPELQAVANLHLRNMHRELLRDALRRRLVYRSWLKEWTEPWVARLHSLPQDQALAVTVSVPPPLDPPGLAEREVDAAAFLRGLPELLDEGQTWPQWLESEHHATPYGLGSAADLDEKHWPEDIYEVDYHRGIKRKRRATREDPPFTWRERIREHEPALITECLRYIRQMDKIIRPYEELEKLLAAGGTLEEAPVGAVAEIAVVGEISRRIVIETMVRGWPSFYLDDARDRAVFDAWAKKHRRRVWAILARQAKRRGVALEPLLEDNVIYDVRFDDDLGCTLRPLMLVDDAVHAQVHGSRAGASAFVPLWTRSTTRPLDRGVLELAPRNSLRAQRLVETAARLDPGASAAETAHLLRLALACHPAEAGSRILQEWSRRLGRDTGREFQRARDLVEARELALRNRYAEALPRITAHLAAEPDPVPDALVIAALCELLPRSDFPGTREELAREARQHDALAGRLNQLLMADFQSDMARRLLEGKNLARKFQGTPFLQRQREIEELRDGIEKAGKRCDALSKELEDQRTAAESSLRAALQDPESIAERFPALARAARHARKELAATLAEDALFPLPSSQAFRDRYGEVHRVVGIRGALEISHALSRISHRIEHRKDEEPWPDGGELKDLARSVWLPAAAKSHLEAVIKELGHGAGDRILSATLVGVLEDAMRSCMTEIKNRMSEAVVAGAPYGETLATYIHIVQTLERSYRTALLALLGARVALARILPVPWTVLDRGLRGMPAGGWLRFEAATGTVVVESAADGRVPLLRCAGIGPEEVSHLEAVFADPNLPARIHRLAPSLADGLLAAEVEPSRGWRLWRDAMEAVTPELLHALSGFAYRACLLPDLAPSLTEEGRRMEERMEEIEPRGEPAIDWAWSDPGAWRTLLGQSFRTA